MKKQQHGSDGACKIVVIPGPDSSARGQAPAGIHWFCAGARRSPAGIASAPRRPPTAKGDGFSLIELMLALVIFGILLALAPPAYRDWIAAQQLANHAHFIVNTLEVARSEAIKRGERVNVCKTRDGRQCADGGGWESGWLMFVDENRNGDIDPDEIVLRREGPARNEITVKGNRPVDDYISYTSLGHARLLNGALQMGTLVVCKPGQNTLHVVLANSGRLRIDKTRERCG